MLLQMELFHSFSWAEEIHCKRFLVSSLSLPQRGSRKAQLLTDLVRLLSVLLVHFKKPQRRDVTQSKLKRKPMVIQEPEVRLLDSQVCVLNILGVRAKGIVTGEARRLGWTSSRPFELR